MWAKASGRTGTLGDSTAAYFEQRLDESVPRRAGRQHQMPRLDVRVRRRVDRQGEGLLRRGRGGTGLSRRNMRVECRSEIASSRSCMSSSVSQNGCAARLLHLEVGRALLLEGQRAFLGVVGEEHLDADLRCRS